MILRMVKYTALGTAGLAVVGGIFFGSDLVSYATSSARTVQQAVKDSVPIEFELKRAQDLLEDIIPEMQANIRLIAQEEVEVANLRAEIRNAHEALSQERTGVGRLREVLAVQRATYTLGGAEYSHQQVKEELARRFNRFKEAEVVLAGKERLLNSREKSLQAAMQMLDRTRSQKVQLEDQIQSLESQYRLVRAAAVGSRVQFDNSKLAQTERLIAQIKKRLDVAERVLAHEAQFVQPIEIDTIDEKELLTQIDEHFAPRSEHAATSQPATLELGYAGQSK